jgi:hypothetical protein
MLLSIAALAGGGLGGFLLGTLAYRKLPVQLRGYFPSRGTVSMRFVNPEYLSLVLDAMKDRQKSLSRKEQDG